MLLSLLRITHSVFLILLLISDIYCLKINVNKSSSAEESGKNGPTNKPDYYYNYNHRIMDLNGTMRKYFAMEALLQESKNFIVSPLAAMLPIGKLYFGAGMEAKREIEHAFGLGYADEIRRVLFHAISNMEKLDGITLNISLFMLLPMYNEVTKEYKDEITKLFNYNLQYVNFEHKAQVADYTNYMFKVLTGGVTDHIVDASEIESNSSLVVFNTCIFKGDWLVPFVNLKNFVFISQEGERKNVKGYLMITTAGYTNDSALRAEIVKINFKTNEACFLVVLPIKSTDLETVLNTIKADPVLMQDAASNMRRVQAQIRLPKFQIENKVELKDIYIKVGVSKIFNSTNPGLSKLLVRDAAWVTRVRQLIKFRLSNMWVAGSADDAGLLSYGDSNDDARKKFPFTQLITANRPFLFYVLHKGEQLFAGAVYDP